MPPHGREPGSLAAAPLYRRSDAIPGLLPLRRRKTTARVAVWAGLARLTQLALSFQDELGESRDALQHEMRASLVKLIETDQRRAQREQVLLMVRWSDGQMANRPDEPTRLFCL